jgi:hypothetical protein
MLQNNLSESYRYKSFADDVDNFAKAFGISPFA